MSSSVMQKKKKNEWERERERERELVALENAQSEGSEKKFLQNTSKKRKAKGGV